MMDVSFIVRVRGHISPEMNGKTWNKPPFHCSFLLSNYPPPESRHGFDQELLLKSAFRKLWRISGKDDRSQSLELLHTDLGQPVVACQGSISSALHISFSHDETMHLSMAADGNSCVGVGTDIVYLPRLLTGYRRSESTGKRGREYFLKFASRFMSVNEWLNYLHFSYKEEDASLLMRTAAHFSLMESASKALGAGLKMGGGIGKPTSLPRTSINILELNPVVVTELNNQAKVRAGMLGADRIESGWFCNGNYLLSYAILFR